MKSKKYIAVGLLAASLGISSCSKDYLETSPTNAVTEETVFTNMDNAWATINGIHRLLYAQWSRQNEGGLGSIYTFMDVMGEDLVHTSTGNGWFNAHYQWVEHRNQNAWGVRYIWRFGYRVMANANNIINNIDDITGPEEEKNEIKGQALFYRAYAHFMLVQLYGERFDMNSSNDGLGVPIMLTTNQEEVPRNTVAEVYQQIQQDIDQSIDLLSNASSRNNKSHINLNVARGLKARIALTTQDWATASEQAGLAKEGFTLMSGEQYMEGFNNISNPEWMWGSAQIADQTSFFYSFFAYMSANFNSTNIRTNPKAINSVLYNQISETDVRKDLWSESGADTPIPPGGARFPYTNRKFLVESSSSSIGDVPNMRAAEMYLIEAEAKARLGSGDAADVLYTLVHERDPNYQRSANSGQALVNEVLLHRRIELWGEGFRFLDLKRLNQRLDRTNSNHQEVLAQTMEIEPGAVEWQFLIHQDELNNNAAMVQNPLSQNP